MDLPIDINGDVGFITGAASGIGLSLAKGLAGKGVRLILCDIDEPALKELASNLNSEAGQIVAIASKADTTSWEEQSAAYELGKQAFGRVDYFFANAGIAEHMWLPRFDDTSHTSSESISKPNLKTLEVDLVGQLYTAALALQVFQRQNLNRHGFRGKLILTASIYGFYSGSTMPLYSVSKAGIVHFMRSTSDFYQDKNITINCICPNITATKIASDDFLAPFREQGLLTPLELVIEQFMSLLGSNKDNGKAIGIVGKEVWVHPADSFKREENEPAFKLIDHGKGQAFGYWK